MIEKRRRKRHGSHIFLITLILTIALGSVVLGCSMIWAVGRPQLVAVKLESQLANLVEDVQAAESVLASAQSAKPVGKYDALLADEALCRQQNIYAKTAASPNETTIVFAGDILFDDHYAVKVKMNQRGRGIEGSISQEMLDVMRSADIFMVITNFPTATVELRRKTRNSLSVPSRNMHPICLTWGLTSFLWRTITRMTTAR